MENNLRPVKNYLRLRLRPQHGSQFWVRFPQFHPLQGQLRFHCWAFPNWDARKLHGLWRRQEWNAKHTDVGLTSSAVLLLRHSSRLASALLNTFTYFFLFICFFSSLVLFLHSPIFSFLCLFLPFHLFFLSSFQLILRFFIHSSLSSLIYLFRANFQIYKPITAKRLCWGSLWACRCGGSWIPITELIWKKTLSVMWKWFGLRVKFIIITLISSQASALAAAKENTKA